MILELICANLINLSINACDRLPTPQVTLDREVVALNTSLSNDKAVYLAKGKPYESEYRREVNEQRRQEEIENRDDRYYRGDRDCYDDYDRDRYDRNNRDYSEDVEYRDYRREYECEKEREREERQPIYRIYR
jgi:hypothetical protein